jgi:hypothetical protein
LPPYKVLRKKYKKNAFHVYMERNFVHFFIVYKKNWNFRPIILGNMEIFKKERFGIWDSKFYYS